MKVNPKCVQNMFRLIGASFYLILLTFCDQPDPEFRNLMTTEYPNLHQYIEERNGAAILEFTNHTDSTIRQHAWRALIQTQVADRDLHLQKVIQANMPVAWASLWLKDLDEQDLKYFHQLWRSDPKYRNGLTTLFAEHGNAETLDLLLNTAQTNDPVFNYNLAYAIGQRSRSLQINSRQEIAIIDRALATKDGALTQAYLYGYYRGRKTFEKEAAQHLLNLWANYYPQNHAGNQSIVRILIHDYTNQVIRHFPIERYSIMDVQLAIEVAQGLGAAEATSFTPAILNTLLDHRNPNVKIAALQAISRHPEIAGRLFSDIMNKVGLNEYAEPMARMVAFNTINNPARYRNQMLETAAEQPFLQTLKYSVLRKTDDPASLFGIVLTDLTHPSRLNRLYALQELAEWWISAPEEFKEETAAQVRAEVLNIISQSDRSMVFVAAPLFMETLIFGEEDLPVFEKLLTGFSLPADVEVYQAISQVLYTRYEEQAQSLIDSLARMGNIALNRTLLTQGWDILQGDYYPEIFRSPDWKRLSKLGPNPYVVIETVKGEIILQLDVLKAPATISGMDQLIRSRAYNGVPFHRVIPNFVVQGGDVETQDGFGGPGYTVPTEASATMYNRGVVGIASAGTDTEGSQFFIMHQWKPHLNGRYTVVGKVVDGMDVVDRLVQGDVIEEMYWY